MGKRMKLRLGEADPLREEGHMHPPLVFATAERSGAIDDDFTLAQREMAAVDQAAGEQLLEQTLVAREGSEKHERSDARRHGAIERALDVRGERRRGGCYAGAHR